jgi:uncharacterized protein (DUF58 family)
MAASVLYGDLLDAVRTLSWPARRRVAGTRTGSHPSTLRGRAPELSEYRLYRQGDDPRDLDWKLLARSDRPFVRLADDRAILETWLVLDASASMAFPDSTHDKWRTASALAVALTSVAQRAGDPVGLLVPRGNGLTRIEATTRRDLPQQIAATLGAITPAGAAPLATATATLPGRVRLVILSDFLGDEAELRARCAVQVSAGGEVVAAHLVSRAELELPADLAFVRDPEAPAVERAVDGAARNAYASTFARWRDELKGRWTAMGASYVCLTAEDDVARSARAVVDSVRLAEV